MWLLGSPSHNCPVYTSTPILSLTSHSLISRSRQGYDALPHSHILFYFFFILPFWRAWRRAPPLRPLCFESLKCHTGSSGSISLLKGLDCKVRYPTGCKWEVWKLKGKGTAWTNTCKMKLDKFTREGEHSFVSCCPGKWLIQGYLLFLSLAGNYVFCQTNYWTQQWERRIRSNDRG